jgi:excisionase family DNA binding protein
MVVLMQVNLDGLDRTYTINQTMNILGIGRTSIYKLVKSGELNALKLGRRTLIAASDIAALVNRLQKEAKAKRAGRAS